MVTEFQKKIVESSSHEKLKSDFYAMLMNEEAYQEQIKNLAEENKELKEKYAKLDKVASENVRTLDELEAERIELVKENKKLKEEKSKLTKRIYKNIKGDMWREYQKFCEKNNI